VSLVSTESFQNGKEIFKKKKFCINMAAGKSMLGYNNRPRRDRVNQTARARDNRVRQFGVESETGVRREGLGTVFTGP